MAASASYFGFGFDAGVARMTLDAACNALGDGVFRMRFALRHGQPFLVQSAPIKPLSEPVRVLLSEPATRADDLFLRHKTSFRTRYDAAWRDAESQGAFDALFFNERGELTEGGRSNVFVRLDGRWCTPPLACGVLPGIMRAVVLADPAWNACERVITRDMLAGAQGVMVCNALRGPLMAALC